jgi:hypothetical protein
VRLEDSIKESIAGYPSLYVRDTYKAARREVLGHIFLTGGNGLEWAHINPREKDQRTYVTSPKGRRLHGDWVRCYNAPYRKGNPYAGPPMERFTEEVFVTLRPARMSDFGHFEFYRYGDRPEWRGFLEDMPEEYIGRTTIFNQSFKSEQEVEEAWELSLKIDRDVMSEWKNKQWNYKTPEFVLHVESGVRRSDFEYRKWYGVDTPTDPRLCWSPYPFFYNEPTSKYDGFGDAYVFGEKGITFIADDWLSGMKEIFEECRYWYKHIKIEQQSYYDHKKGWGDNLFQVIENLKNDTPDNKASALLKWFEERPSVHSLIAEALEVFNALHNLENTKEYWHEFGRKCCNVSFQYDKECRIVELDRRLSMIAAEQSRRAETKTP